MADPADADRVEVPAVKPCEQCGAEFAPRRTTALYCSPRCRKRAQRDRQAAELAALAAAAAQVDAEVEAEQVAVEGLVAALRTKLEGAGGSVAESFEGQLALQLASKIANPGESGVATLAKVLLTVVDTAMASAPPPQTGGPGEAPEPGPAGDHDEEDEMRRRRDLKLAAAGQAADRA